MAFTNEQQIQENMLKNTLYEMIKGSCKDNKEVKQVFTGMVKVMTGSINKNDEDIKKCHEVIKKIVIKYDN